MNLNSLFNSPIFWVILVFAIGFVIFSGIKKRRNEKKSRNKRENEVKSLIKEHLRETENYKNIAIEYVEVIPRTGKIYRSRDVFDVFVKVLNPRKNNLLVAKKVYEIEGVASPNPKSKDKNDSIVHWSINREFVYDEHLSLIKWTPPSKWRIYLRSLNKKNRKKYIQEEKTKLADWRKREKDIQKELKQKKKKSDEEQVFRPKVKTKSESL